MPSVYTLDAHVFDELVTHLNGQETVGTPDNPRLLPRGMDILAAFGSKEAKKILLEELDQGRFENYEKRLDALTARIESFPASSWDCTVYQRWLAALDALIKDPPPASPEFTRTMAWKKKSLSTALGSWVNLRYETIGWVEQEGAEAGEGGYERLYIGLPKGYVEPNPLFFHKLDEGFGAIEREFGVVVRNRDLKKALSERIEKHRSHLKALETIARKELDKAPLTDKEYGEILYIGRTVEHFILVMNSLSGHTEKAGGLKVPDPIRKIVDVQNYEGTRLYEALGFAHEIQVAVPYFGRRIIVKGPVYSYYEFQSPDQLDSEKWKQIDNPELPVWIEPYYLGKDPYLPESVDQ
jgi:hypothetical protein